MPVSYFRKAMPESEKFKKKMRPREGGIELNDLICQRRLRKIYNR